MYGIKQTILLVLALSLFSTLVSTAEVTSAPKIKYDLTISISGSGSTTPLAGTYSYNMDRVVRITASPNLGWRFDRWSGDVVDPNSDSTTVTMDSDKTVIANFTRITHDLTLSINGSGSISPPAGSHTYNWGTVVNITATPESGWLFGSWSGDVANPNSASTTVTMDSDKTVIANFTEISGATYDLTIAISGNGAASPPAGSHTYNIGTVVDITASPGSGWLFVNWTGNVADPNSASTTVTMDGDKTITAHFTEIAEVKYNLTMDAIGNGITSPPEGIRTYNAGMVINISATPDSGWMFFKWTGDVADPNSASTTVTMDGDKTLTANFTQTAGITYVLTITTNGNGITSPSLGSHRYNEDAVVEVTATPDEGWEFDSWSGEVDEPDSASTTVLVDADKTLTAIFTQITHDGEAGGCGCGSNRSVISVNELLLGWGIIGFCWGGGYYAVRRSGKRNI